mmetsp:Transcript_11587/g.20938  ORF Transcript_11587/g.20938 Transcript_11587/m.20938 type:complete len:758 (+) Transcript_11587:890-3163(+)
MLLAMGGGRDLQHQPCEAVFRQASRRGDVPEFCCQLQALVLGEPRDHKHPGVPRGSRRRHGRFHALFHGLLRLKQEHVLVNDEVGTLQPQLMWEGILLFDVLSHDLEQCGRGPHLLVVPLCEPLTHLLIHLIRLVLCLGNELNALVLQPLQPLQAQGLLQVHDILNLGRLRLGGLLVLLALSRLLGLGFGTLVLVILLLMVLHGAGHSVHSIFVGNQQQVLTILLILVVAWCSALPFGPRLGLGVLFIILFTAFSPLLPGVHDLRPVGDVHLERDIVLGVVNAAHCEVVVHGEHSALQEPIHFKLHQLHKLPLDGLPLDVKPLILLVGLHFSPAGIPALVICCPEDVLQLVGPQVQLLLRVSIAPQVVIDLVELDLEVRHLRLLVVRPYEELVELLLQHDKVLGGPLPQVAEGHEDVGDPAAEYKLKVVPLADEQRCKLGIQQLFLRLNDRIVEEEDGLAILSNGWWLLGCFRWLVGVTLCQRRLIPLALLLPGLRHSDVLFLGSQGVLDEGDDVVLHVGHAFSPVHLGEDAVLGQPLGDALGLMVKHHQLLLEHGLVGDRGPVQLHQAGHPVQRWWGVLHVVQHPVGWVLPLPREAREHRRVRHIHQHDEVEAADIIRGLRFGGGRQGVLAGLVLRLVRPALVRLLPGGGRGWGWGWPVLRLGGEMGEQHFGLHRLIAAVLVSAELLLDGSHPRFRGGDAVQEEALDVGIGLQELQPIHQQRDKSQLINVQPVVQLLAELPPQCQEFGVQVLHFCR